MANHSSARNQSLDFLDNLGESQNNFAPVSSGLEKVCGDFINRVVDNINRADVVDSGRMSDLTMTVVSDTQIRINGQRYINYVDEGIQGAINNTRAPFSPYKYTNKMPPPKVFEEWIKSKNIKVRNTKYYTDQGSDIKINVSDSDIKSVAYAMAKDRYDNGAYPVPIFKKEIPKLIQDATNTVGQIMIGNIISTLDL